VCFDCAVAALWGPSGTRLRVEAEGCGECGNPGAVGAVGAMAAAGVQRRRPAQLQQLLGLLPALIGGRTLGNIVAAPPPSAAPKPMPPPPTPNKLPTGTSSAPAAKCLYWRSPRPKMANFTRVRSHVSAAGNGRVGLRGAGPWIPRQMESSKLLSHGPGEGTVKPSAGIQKAPKKGSPPHSTPFKIPSPMGAGALGGKI